MATKSLTKCRYPGCKNLVPYDTPYCKEHSLPELRLCKYPGCKTLTKERYCEKHKKQIQHEDHLARADRFKKYAKNWNLISKAIRNKEPFCRECLKNGKYTPSECVDHIDGNPKNNKTDNLQALCWSCHSRKTAIEKSGWAKRKNQQGKGG